MFHSYHFEPEVKYSLLQAFMVTFTSDSISVFSATSNQQGVNKTEMQVSESDHNGLHKGLYFHSFTLAVSF